MVELVVLHVVGALGVVGHFGVVVGVLPLRVHVRDVQEAVELVIAERGRQVLGVVPQVPLADQAGGIALALQERGEGDRLDRDAARIAVHGRIEDPVVDGELAGVDRRPGGRAGGLGVGRGEEQPLVGEAVDVRSRRAHGRAAAVDPEVAPAHVVGQEEEDVGLLAPGLRCRDAEVRADPAPPALGGRGERGRAVAVLRQLVPGELDLGAVGDPRLHVGLRGHQLLVETLGVGRLLLVFLVHLRVLVGLDDDVAVLGGGGLRLLQVLPLVVVVLPLRHAAGIGRGLGPEPSGQG